MTDIARTLAEVKALLGDNNTRAISPQDVRDVVESMIRPIPGGGFASPYVPEALYDRYAVYAFNPSPPDQPVLGSSPPGGYATNPIILPLGASTPGRMGTWSSDPQGWAVNSYTLAANDPHNTWGIAEGPGDVLLLPQGTYRYALYVSFSPAVDYDGLNRLLQATFDQGWFDPGANSGSGAPWIYKGYFNPGEYVSTPSVSTARAGVTFFTATGFVVQDEPTPQPFIVAVTKKDVTVDTTFVYWDLRILRQA